MNIRVDLKELSVRESEQVEWKENVADVDNVLKTIAAFANDFQNLGGGYVVCGAIETKDEQGFQTISCPGLTASRFKEVEGKVMAGARDKIDPAVAPLVEELPGETEGHRVLVFIVPGTGNAHSYRSGGKDSSAYYVRLSRETVEARNGILRELLVRKKALPPWDKRLNDDATLQDIDLLAFRSVLEEIGAWKPSLGVEDYFSETQRLSEFIPSLGSTRPLDPAIHPRNFALLLFGKEPTRFFPGAYMKFSVYPGMDRSELTSERYDITGTIVQQARRAIDLLRAHSSTAFNKDSQVPNAPKYPERALKEAVINSLAHRDYELDDPSSITVFADRVEIRSPGSLRRTVDKDKFLSGTASPSWRNQTLAYFFNKLQLAQAEGQGIPTIIKTMEQLGSPAPRFELEEMAVGCVLPAHPRHEMMRHVAEIERLIVQRDFDAAETKLAQALAEQPTAPQLLDLFVQLTTYGQRPHVVGDYVQKHQLNPENLPASTVFQLAEVLIQSPEAAHERLGRAWLEQASLRSLEGDEVKRGALALRKIGDDERAVKMLTQFISRSASPFTVSATLYDIRARARIDLAKKCMGTERDSRFKPDMQAKAWERCRRYLDEAEVDIIRALDIEQNSKEREYFERDLEFVRLMKAQVEKPHSKSGEKRSTGQQRGRSGK